LEEASRAIEDNRECAEIFESVTAERRKNLVNKFLQSHHGLVDLENLIKALHETFLLLRLTALDNTTNALETIGDTQHSSL
jgi:F0F1-type ATP synthase delta subunit